MEKLHLLAEESNRGHISMESGFPTFPHHDISGNWATVLESSDGETIQVRMWRTI